MVDSDGLTLYFALKPGRRQETPSFSDFNLCRKLHFISANQVEFLRRRDLSIISSNEIKYKGLIVEDELLILASNSTTRMKQDQAKVPESIKE